MKVLFHDVDGCLNATDGEPLPFSTSPFTDTQSTLLRRLAAAVDASPIDRLVLNTGRSLHDTLNVAEQLNTSKLSHLVVEHGAIYYDMSTDTRLDAGSHAHSDDDDLATALASQSTVEAMLDWYATTGRQALKDRTGVDFAPQAKDANLTVVIHESLPGEALIDTLRELIEGHNLTWLDHLVFHHSSSEGYVDVMSLVSKATGVEIVKRMHPGQTVETFAVGNGLNDLPMLRAVDYPICPNNADDEVREFCTNAGGEISPHSYIEASIDWVSRL